jgi:hypothetical protein
MDLDFILQFNGKAVNVLRYHSTHSLILTREGVSGQIPVHVCSCSLQRPRDIISIWLVWLRTYSVLRQA